jgi:hypothetical protein
MLAIITANMGNFDKMIDPVEQSVPFDFYRFTDKNFPPRYCAMTPRLQARIPKIFGWQMIPDYDYYIWIDSSMGIISPDTVKWLRMQCEGFEGAFFVHPDRQTIREEADFIKKKISEKNYYLSPRYTNELIDEEMKEIESDKGYKDNLLIASTVFIYKNTEATRNMMKEWWYHTSRYHIVDQLGLPYAIYKSGMKINLINEHYMKTPYLKYVRNK